MTNTEKRPAGRPSKYDPAYCDLVIDDAKEGFSLTAFAGGIQIDRDTVTEWRKVHPEFDSACRAAKAVRGPVDDRGITEAGRAMIDRMRSGR